MSAINRLPAELFIAILEALLDQLSKDTHKPTLSFFHSIRCCKHWYMTGMPILFDTIVLQYPQFSSRQPLLFNPNRLLLAKSLIVQARADDFSSHRELHRRLRDPQIDKTLPLRVANNLTSFSLVFTVYQTPGNWHHSLSIGSVKALLNCLPNSVVNLDLDVPGLGVTIRPERTGHRIGYATAVLDESRHLCSTLSPILRRLKSLRVRASMICEDLFSCLAHNSTYRNMYPEHLVEKTTSPLQTIILRLDPWNAAHAARHCNDASERLLPNWSDPSTQSLTEHLAASLLAVREVGALPHIQTCKIVDFATQSIHSPIRLDVFFNMLQGAPNKEYMTAFPKAFRREQYFRVMDVLQNKVTMVPYLQHARTTSDFGGSKRTWETQTIDWESRIDVEKTWRWI